MCGWDEDALRDGVNMYMYVCVCEYVCVNMCVNVCVNMCVCEYVCGEYVWCV